MSRFYGVVSGAAKTPATRRGHLCLQTDAASWKGAIRVHVYLNDAGEECYTVEHIPWHGKGDYQHIVDGKF